MNNSTPKNTWSAKVSNSLWFELYVVLAKQKAHSAFPFPLLSVTELENNNNNNNNNNNGNYNVFYVGPTCSNGFDINLATFTDAGCSTKASSGKYESLTGTALPYEKSSMVSNDCVACLYVDQDADDDGNGDVEINELCEQSVEDAAKCESGLSSVKYYADESGCDYINNILPKLARATSSITGSKINRSAMGGGGGGAAVTFAVIFGLTTAVMGAYSFFLYRKIHRAKVNLSAGEGSMA
jgi:hypothetical protein